MGRMNNGDQSSRGLKELSVRALLGTERAAQSGETSATLLARAAVVGLRARAGRRFRATAGPAESCPPDATAAASVSQAAMLERLLASPDAALIQEWCVLAHARGLRVPAIIVPVLLEWWAKQPSRSPEVFDATGTCGVWLAGLNPDWRKPVALSAIPADVDDVWQTGTVAQRAALLVTVRNSDRERAMAMVRSTWDADGAEERRRFVEILGQGVSLAEESFFESALEDRSKTVRREAARVLTGLGGSGLRTRMRDRAASMIVVEKAKSGLLRSGKITVKIEPPKSFDKAWERDGIEDQAASGKGKRAFWMTQVLAATDLAMWTDVSGLAPPELLASIENDEYFNEVLEAMLAGISACPSQRDADSWGDAIVTTCANRKFANVDRLALIWGAFGIARSEALRHLILARHRAIQGADVWRVLTSDARPWSLDFSKHALKIMRDATPAKADSWEYWSLIESVSKLLHPGTAELFDDFIGAMYPDGPSESIRKSLDRVRLRAELHREFQS